MDAGLNDNIYIDIKYLRNIKLTIGIGYNYLASDLNGQTFVFTESVNETGGYIKFPFDYKGFVIIQYDPTTIPNDPNQEDGEWEFDIQFIKNPYKDKINDAFGE